MSIGGLSLSVCKTFEAGNECGDMVHEQELSCWFDLNLEHCHCNYSLIKAFSLTRGDRLLRPLEVLQCRVAFRSLPRDMKGRLKRIILTY